MVHACFRYFFFSFFIIRKKTRSRRVQEEDDTIYDEVTEDQYKSIVKGRLQRDDFVDDDGAGGYMNNGMDEWSDGNDESEDEEEIRKGILFFHVYDSYFT